MAGSKNVILIEDDAMIRELYTTILVESQYHVETAVSASELYDKLHTYHPDYVLLDLMLPGVSGMEILKELRSNPVHGCQKAKIILLTNMSESDFQDEAIKNGADGYLIKADTALADLPKIIESA